MTELENEEILIDPKSMEDVINKGKNCLSMKYYNYEAFKITMKEAWRLTKTLKYVEIGKEMMMAEFDNQHDKQRIMRDGPWNFNKSLILMKYFDGTQQVKSIDMTKAFFWVRVHNLPLMARSEFIGNVVGKSLGKLEEIELDHGEVE